MLKDLNLLDDLFTTVAQQQRFGLPDNFMRESPNVIEPWVIILIIFGAIAVFFAVMMWRRYQTYSEKVERDSIFHEVCDHIGLLPQHRSVLEEIAMAEELTSPIVLLVSPDTLEFHANAYFEKTADHPQPSKQVMVKEARKIIFE